MLTSGAEDWLTRIGAHRTAPLDPPTLRGRLEAAQLPTWPVLFEVEARWGRTRGVYTDGRELWIGVAPHGQVIRGRMCVDVGGFGPIRWLMGETGTVVELDDLGNTFYESDSLEKRIEQLAMEDRLPGGAVARVDRAAGAEIAAAHGLPPIPGPTDTRQRFFGDAQVVVIESTEPVDYGAEALWTVTYLYAETDEVLRGVHPG